jgi:PAS domain S-box-containing protein
MQNIWRHMHRNGDLLEVETEVEDLEFDGLPARLVRVKDLNGQRRVEQVQRDLTERLRKTLESITDAFYTVDRDWCFTYVNARAKELMRQPRDDLLDCNLWKKFPAALGTIFQHEFETAMASGETAYFEGDYAPFDEWREVYVYPSSLGLAVYCRDVTPRHQVSQQLLEEHALLTSVVNATSNGVITLDEEGRIVMFNRSAEVIFQRNQTSMRGQCMDVLLPEYFCKVHPGQRQQFFNSGVTSRMMGLSWVKGLRGDGQELDLEVTISQVKVQQRVVLMATVKDVTERVRSDRLAKRSQLQLTELAHKLMSQEKVLVKRLAQALHDQLGQTLAAIRMSHEAILTLQVDLLPPEVDRLQSQMTTLIEQGIRQVRQVLIDLRPPLLEEQGLAPALNNELRNWALKHPWVNISIAVPPALALLRWPGKIEYVAFMIVREAVENALRHAGALSIHVALEGSPDFLQLKITDNGVGLVPGEISEAGHLGILGMQERAKAVNAVLTFEAVVPRGTCVRLAWTAPRVPTSL